MERWAGFTMWHCGMSIAHMSRYLNQTHPHAKAPSPRFLQKSEERMQAEVSWPSHCSCAVFSVVGGDGGGGRVILELVFFKHLRKYFEETLH